MKKGMTQDTLVILIIAVVGLIIMGYGVKSWADTIKYGTDKEACKQSVQLIASTKLFGETNIVNIPLKCSTKYEFIKNKKDIENINKILAGDMYDCWDQFGEGKIDFLRSYTEERILKQRYCFVCSKINFDDSIKGKKINGFGDYLLQNNIPFGSITYADYISPGVGEADIKQIFNELNTDEPLYVLFYADKAFDWEKTPGTVKVVAGALALPGCVIGFAIGSVPGCVIGGAITGGQYLAFKTKFGYIPQIVLGSGKEIERICQQK